MNDFTTTDIGRKLQRELQKQLDFFKGCEGSSQAQELVSPHDVLKIYTQHFDDLFEKQQQLVIKYKAKLEKKHRLQKGFETKLREDKEEIDHLQKQLEDLEMSNSEQKLKLKELDVKLKLQTEDFNKIQERSLEEVSPFLETAVRMETELLKKKEEAISQRDALLIRLSYYQKYLGCHLSDSTQPDEYVLHFNSTPAEGDPYIKMKASNDYKDWEVIAMTGDPERVEEAIFKLKQSNNIQEFLVKAKEYYTSMGFEENSK